MERMDTICREMLRIEKKFHLILSQLIKIESSYGQERSGQMLVKSILEDIGLPVKEYSSRNDNQAINLVTRIPGKSSDHRSLVLNAHCDTAPVDDPQRWDRDPFSGTIEDGVIYGRGAQDDKAGVAIILMIAQLVKTLELSFLGDLILQSVIEDETTGNGSDILVKNGFTGDGVIIVDGTWSERIIFGHLGQLWLEIEILGEPVAACVENRGENPIYIAWHLIQKIKDFIEGQNAVTKPFGNIAKPFFFNVGSIQSGRWAGSVPSKAIMEIQIGFPESFTPEEVSNHIKVISNKLSGKIVVREKLLKVPAFKGSKNNQLIHTLEDVIKRNSGKEVEKFEISGHCDMRLFNTPNVCLYGPGRGKNPHGLNECYFLDQMSIVAKNILEFALLWCNGLPPR